jgi:hypothetical protein
VDVVGEEVMNKRSKLAEGIKTRWFSAIEGETERDGEQNE